MNTPTLIRIETDTDRLFIVVNGVQRQIVNQRERENVLSQLANVSVMNQVGTWATYAIEGAK